MSDLGGPSAFVPAGFERWRARSLPPAIRELDEDRDRFENPVLVFTFEHLCWLIAGLYAIASRLTLLGDRPLAPKEAGIALFDYRLSREGLSALRGGGFTLPALMHLVQAALMKVAPANDYTARMGLAFCALGLIAIAYTMRRYIGRIGALGVAGLIAISPTITWLSRSDSMATLALMAALITLRLFLAFCRTPRFAIAVGMGVGAALTMSCDATGQAIVPIMIAAGVLLVGWERIANPDFREDIGFLKGIGTERLGVAAIVGAAFYVSLTPHRLLLPAASEIWALKAFKYYAPIAATYEILIVTLAGTAAYLCAANRIRSPFARWCTIWAALSVGSVLVIPARSVEFAVLMLLPMGFLAGFAVEYLYHAQIWPRVRIPLLIAGATTLYFQIASNFIGSTPVLSQGVAVAHALALWSGAATTDESRSAGEKIAATWREERVAHQPRVYVAADAMLDPVRWYLRDFATAADPNSAEVVVFAGDSQDTSAFATAKPTEGRLERIAVVVTKETGWGPHPALAEKMLRYIFAPRQQDRIDTVEATIAWHSGAESAARRLNATEEASSQTWADRGTKPVASSHGAAEKRARTLSASAAKAGVSKVRTIETAQGTGADLALNASPSLSAMVSAPPPRRYGRSGQLAKLSLSGKVAGSRENPILGKRSLKIVAELEPASRQKRRMMRIPPTRRSGPDSKVLIVGGQDEKGGFITASAEFFDSDTGNFIPIKSGMADPRESYSATRLPNDDVLIAGGRSTVDGDIVATAEIFDPVLGTFTSTHSIMTAARQAHTATPLANGKVLIAGGFNALDGVLNSGEIFDPATGVFSPAGSMTDGRRSHTATALRDGRVLITGGIDQADRIAASAEIFNPASGSFSATADMHDSRYQHTATALKNGRVLITGGIDDGGEVLATAEIFDPATQAFRPTTGMMRVGRYLHAAALLRNGMVLISGGFTNRSSGVTASVELFDPATEIFIEVGQMNEPRESHAATLLGSGKVLITGGGVDFNGRVADSAELFDPGTRKFTLTRTRMVESREVHTATLVR
ncbi:MAG TPA: kelch repeat-containing protein [Candidatus Binataceae bacterium]